MQFRDFRLTADPDQLCGDGQRMPNFLFILVIIGWNILECKMLNTVAYENKKFY